ncbi:hypothetical protein CL634_02510 [bacterium]|nr:hypothetical protein [bacterium]|tara:strand:- start:765 stop:1562 length:798 start_codon:yes stop_codon:yes gene_type:complete
MEGPKLNIAIMVCGHWRDGRRCYENFVNRIKGPNSHHNLDLFVITSGVDSARGTVTGKTYMNPVGEVKHDKKYYKKHGLIYNVSKDELKKEIEEVYKEENLIGVYLTEEEIEDNNINPMSWEWFRRGIFSKPFYGMQKVKEHQKQTNIKYDVVLRTRPDLILRQYITIEKPDENTLYTFGGWKPWVHSKKRRWRALHKYMVDFFAYGSVDTMETYTNIHLAKEPIKTGRRKHPFQSEWQLCLYLKKHNIQRNFILNKRNLYNIPR